MPRRNLAKETNTKKAAKVLYIQLNVCKLLFLCTIKLLKRKKYIVHNQVFIIINLH